MDRIVGIDLGTTNSVVAYYEQGHVVVIPNAEGSKTTPSVVLYKGPNEIIVGEMARRQLVSNPRQAVRSVKRFMGALHSELGNKCQGIAYEVVPGPNDSVLIDVGWTRITPEQVSAQILMKMKSTAEDYFGESVERAVVTVPAYFNDTQRAATKRAGEIAGLDVVRIINEPTAAALAYGVDKNKEQRIAVFDFGGGTFDVSVLEIDRDIYEVKSTRGDTFLGGDNIDALMIDAAVAQFKADTGVDLSTDIQAIQRLTEAVEKVKCELSTAPETLLSVPFIGAGASGPLHVNRTIKRPELEELIAPLLPRLTSCCSEALRDGHVTPDLITNVLLVGGSTRIPAVQQIVRDYFKREPNRTLNPDEAVAAGAAIQGSILSGGLREVLLLDVTPLSLGVELAGDLFSILIPRNSSIPTAAHKTFTTVRDNQKSVRVHVLQGERKVVRENHSLGVFRLVGITPAPKEIPAIDVCFQIDANGILNVSASDATSGASSSITIENYAVTNEEAEEVVKAAESAAAEDRAFLQRTQIKQQADVLMASYEPVLSDTENPLPLDVEKQIRQAAFHLDAAHARGTMDDLEEALAQLRSIGGLIGERLLMMRVKQDLEQQEFAEREGRGADISQDKDE